jgi:hypothetical protein
MNRASWKDGAELIGVLAIVLSLIFVGFQIKQAAAYDELKEMTAAQFDELVEATKHAAEEQ